MADGTSFGRLLKARRRARDLTQEELAKQVAYSVITIRKVEADERRPSRQLAERLAVHLAIPAEERAAFVALARAEPGRAEFTGPLVYPQAGVNQPAAGPAPEHPAVPGPDVNDPATARPPVNLPTPLTRLIGRDEQVAATEKLLTRADVRLVTLVGPPGIGKSRLGVRVAGAALPSFPDGVYFVPLAPLGDPALVAPTIAKTLGVKEQVGSSPLERLIDFLRDRRVLLLLDNCEHLLGAAPFIVDVLTACPGVKVLATSRAALHLRGERLITVPPLDCPRDDRDETAAAVRSAPAVQLFVERAQDADPDFTLTDANAGDVAAVCANLDGLPLAIELVAVRTRMMSPADMRARIGGRLELLTGGPLDLPARQQTLRNTIDWSYNLLDEEERTLFARLGVFNGGGSADAIREITGGSLDGVAALVTHNLLGQEVRVDGERHFLFLATIREYALERLAASGEESELRDRHAGYYLRLAEAAQPHLTSPEQQRWLDRLEAARDDLRSALEWYVQRGATEASMRLVAALWKFWHVRGRHLEGHRWLSLVLDMTGPCLECVRAQALHGSGWIAFDRGDLVAADEYFRASLDIFRGVSDPHGVAEALHGVGVCAQARGEPAEAAALFAESLDLHRDLHDDEGVAWSLDHLGDATLSMGDHDRADELFRESLAIFVRLRHTWGVAISRHHQGLVALSRGDSTVAEERLREGLAIFEEIDNAWGIASSYNHFGYAALLRDDVDAARDHFARALRRNHAEQDRDGVARSLAGLATITVRQGRTREAARLFGAAEATSERAGIHLSPVARAIYDRDVAMVRAALGDAAVDQALADARAMTMNQLVTLALGD